VRGTTNVVTLAERSRLGRRGALSQPHSLCAEIEPPKASRTKRGGDILSPPDYGFGDPRKLPQRDFVHISGQKEAIWNTLFSIFERWRGPPNVAGPGKVFPPTLDGHDHG